MGHVLKIIAFLSDGYFYTILTQRMPTIPLNVSSINQSTKN